MYLKQDKLYTGSTDILVWYNMAMGDTFAIFIQYWMLQNGIGIMCGPT